MKYRGYLKKMSERFEAEFKRIAAHYNFDHGPEFEIALCEVLRLVLPQKFGICRGFVVPADGEAAHVQLACRCPDKGRSDIEPLGKRCALCIDRAELRRLRTRDNPQKRQI